jgi:hypothetical protein
MITYRHLFGLAAGFFVFAFALVIGGAVVEFSFGKHGTVFLMPGLVAAGLGLVSGWSARLFKQQFERIAHLEVQLRDRANS